MNKNGDTYNHESYRGTQKKNIHNPLEGMTADDVRMMSDEALLDMDYFLHKDDDLDDGEFFEEGFFLF